MPISLCITKFCFLSSLNIDDNVLLKIHGINFFQSIIFFLPHRPLKVENKHICFKNVKSVHGSVCQILTFTERRQ